LEARPISARLARPAAVVVIASPQTANEKPLLMPDPRSLKVGDLVRFIALPEAWSRPDYHVHRESVAFMKELIRRSWPSRVCAIDEYGYPWIRARVRQRGVIHHHHWLITESTGWRRVNRRT
jgi:hypothetical protein